MNRRVLHLDMDAFFASVEQARDPSLRGKPVVVGGSSDKRGVVCTASYEARKYGVHSAMPIATAKRLCPHAIFLPGNSERYLAASEKVEEILRTVSPLVEAMSLDEAFVDITGSRRLFPSEDVVAQYLRNEIRHKLDLPASVGIAGSKLVAKIACDEAKPDNYLIVSTGKEHEFLAPLPVKKMLGVGERTLALLTGMGIRTIGQLANTPADKLIKAFGVHGMYLHQKALGVDPSPVVVESPLPKSVSRETTFEDDSRNWRYVTAVISYLMGRALYAMRQHRMKARRVTLKVRYSDFSTVTFAKTLPEPTQVDGEIFRALEQLIPKAKQRRDPVRLVGVCLSNLVYDNDQLGLFDERWKEKWAAALRHVDKTRDRYGFELLRTARSVVLGQHYDYLTPSLSL